MIGGSGIMRILIADDDTQVAESLRQVLVYLGHEVAVAPQPSVAIEQLEAWAPEVLLLDWLMPDGGGEQVIRTMLRSPHAWTRVVLMTGSSRETLPESVRHLPVLYKPFRLHKLVAALNPLPPTVSGGSDQ
jgi:CheY-like chemotaxis protein